MLHVHRHVNIIFYTHQKYSFIVKDWKNGSGKRIGGQKIGFSELIIMVKFSSHLFQLNSNSYHV